MNVSVIVPLLNEEESIRELVPWIEKVCKTNNMDYEVILIDDGSTDGSWGVIQELCSANKDVRGIKFRRNYGKSAAIHTGFQSAKGDVVITMDADLQDSPDEIPQLYRMIAEENYDMVSGWKKKDMIRSVKEYRVNFLTGPPEKLRGLYYMILIVV